MKKFVSALTCASLILFTSCSEKPDGNEIGTTTLNLNPTEIQVSDAAQTVEVAIETNSDFIRANSNADWVVAELADKTLTLKISANRADERYAEVKVISGMGSASISAVLPITQAGKPVVPDNPEPGTIALGAEYEGGIIVEITEEYIKIISKTEAEGEALDKELAWSPADYVAADKYVGSYDKADGRINMAKIKETQSWASVCPAAKWCEDLGADWYWPGLDELKTVCKDADLFAKTGMVPDKYYWSSTESEIDATKARATKFKTETQGPNDGAYSKTGVRYIRAMKRIPIQK